MVKSAYFEQTLMKYFSLVTSLDNADESQFCMVKTLLGWTIFQFRDNVIVRSVMFHLDQQGHAFQSRDHSRLI